MAEAELHHLYEDVEVIKRDLALIKHVLLEEGELTPDAHARLEKSRKTPLSECEEL